MGLPGRRRHRRADRHLTTRRRRPPPPGNDSTLWPAPLRHDGRLVLPRPGPHRPGPGLLGRIPARLSRAGDPASHC
ncbi:hypothetical protein HBB16_18765 [Pseudonocardia sp. MCCB 268]|nr:hypothetical protein [Pseudonocardia cytotoxica]